MKINWPSKTEYFHQNWEIQNSMGFYPYYGLTVSTVTLVPLISIKIFHWIPWNLECANTNGTSSSMEFHGTWSVNFWWHEQFHGIPWNLEWANFEDMMRSISVPTGHQQWNFLTFSRLLPGQVPPFTDILQHENTFWPLQELAWIT